MHTVTFSSVFICVFTLKRMQTLLIYDRSCSLFYTLEIFSFGPCVQGVKTIKRDKNVFENAGKRRPCAHSRRVYTSAVSRYITVQYFSTFCTYIHSSSIGYKYFVCLYPLKFINLIKVSNIHLQIFSNTFVVHFTFSVCIKSS